MEGGSPSHQPKYKGVRLRKWGKWVSEVRLPNSRERIWLGSYDSAEKAARAFDAAQFCLRGPKAKFNFPDSPPDISGGQMLSPAEIQAVAARFANDLHSSVVQEIPSQGNINSHVTNLEEEEMSLSSTNCEVVQMDTNNNNNNNKDNNCTGAEMDGAFYHDMIDNYSYPYSEPSPDFFSDPYYPGEGVLGSLSSNLYSPLHFPPRTTPNYDDDDTGNGGDDHCFQQSFLWNF